MFWKQRHSCKQLRDAAHAYAQLHSIPLDDVSSLMESDANIKDMNTSTITRCDLPVVDMIRSEVYVLQNGHLQSASTIRRVY